MATKKSAASKVDATATETQSAPSNEGARSKADRFDQVADGKFDNGKFEARVEELVLQDFNEEKGQSVRVKYRLATGKQTGEELTNWFKIFNAAEDENEATVCEGGVKMLRNALAKMGYKDWKFSDLADICDEVSDDHPGVSIQIKNNEGFVNAYVQGLVDDSPALAELNETHPF